MFPNPLAKIELTKELAAMRQTYFAMEAFKTGDFDVAITLAGAAEELLPEIDGQDVFSRLRNDPRGIELFGDKRWSQLVNLERNWLKHQTIEFGVTITVSAMDAAYMIIRAMAKLPKWTDDMVEFKTWYFEVALPADHAATPSA